MYNRNYARVKMPDKTKRFDLIYYIKNNISNIRIIIRSEYFVS